MAIEHLRGGGGGCIMIVLLDYYDSTSWGMRIYDSTSGDRGMTIVSPAYYDCALGEGVYDDCTCGGGGGVVILQLHLWGGGGGGYNSAMGVGMIDECRGMCPCTVDRFVEIFGQEMSSNQIWFDNESAPNWPKKIACTIIIFWPNYK